MNDNTHSPVPQIAGKLCLSRQRGKTRDYFCFSLGIIFITNREPPALIDGN